MFAKKPCYRSLLLFVVIDLPKNEFENYHS